MSNSDNEIDLLANYIDKVDYSATFHDIAGDRKHSIAMVAGDRLKILNDLLCTIHKDEGQRIKEVGYKQAAYEAVKIAAELVKAGDEE